MKKLFVLLSAVLAAALYAAGISGKVLDSASKAGIAGVLVTNGVDVTVSGQDGAYVLPERKNVRFVSVVMPADRKAPAHYQEVQPGKNIDFLLDKRPVRKQFSFIHIGDTETYKYNQIFPYFINFAKNNDVAFIIHTGDICRESGIKFHRQHLTTEKAGVPVYYSIGNHDFCGQSYGEKPFEDAFGPISYAFEEGDFRFIVVPMHRGDKAARMSKSEVVSFVRNILKHTPADKKIIFLSHYNWYFENDGKFGYNKNLVDLSGHDVRALFYGHTHKHYREDRGRIRHYSTGMSSGGGGGNGVAAFRHCKIDENGGISTELQPLYVKDFFSTWMSDDRDADGSRQVAIGCYDTTDVVKKVTMAYGSGKYQSVTPLEKVAPWLYAGKFKSKNSKGFVTITAEFASGRKLTRKLYFPLRAWWKTPFKFRRVIAVPGRLLFTAPVIDGDVLYIGTADDDECKKGGIYAYSISGGNLLWSYINGAGFRGPLAFSRGAVYGCDSTGARIKLDAKTGKLLEKIEPAVRMSNYGGVQILGDHIVSGNQNALIVSDLDGKVLWRNTQNSYNGFGAVDCGVFKDGVLFTGVSWLPVVARKISDGTVLWQFRKKEHFSMPTFGFNKDGNLIICGGRNILLLDPKTGKVLVDASGINCATASRPVVVGDRCFFGTTWDGVAAVDASTLKPLWMTKRATGRALIGTAAYRLPSFTVESTPVVFGDKLLVSGGDGRLYCLDQATGKTEWFIPHNTAFLYAPSFNGKYLIQPDYAGRLFVWEYIQQK